MKLPYFKSWDNTPVAVNITDGIDENGAPKVVSIYSGKCNIKEVVKTVRSADGEYIRLSAVITMSGDIAPLVPALNGNVTIGGCTWEIYSSARPRNPDGTINHTRLELL